MIGTARLARASVVECCTTFNLRKVDAWRETISRIPEI
jgi:hypothetical protein